MSLRSVHFLAVPGGQMQCLRQLIQHVFPRKFVSKSNVTLSERLLLYESGFSINVMISFITLCSVSKSPLILTFPYLFADKKSISVFA